MLNLFKNAENSLNSNESRPDWDIFVIPKVRIKKSETNGDPKGGPAETFSAIFISTNHAYGDANMWIVFAQECLCDKDLNSTLPQLLSSMQTGEKLQVMQRAAKIFQTLLYTPLTLIQLYLKNEKTVFNSENFNYSSETLTGLSLSSISTAGMSRIRAVFGCQTRSVIAYAFLQGLKTVVEKKGLELPNAINLGFTHAVLPYSKTEAENRTSIYIKRLPMFGSQTEILAKIDELLQINEEAEQQISCCFWAIKVFGVLPIMLRSAINPYIFISPCGVTLVPSPQRRFTYQSSVIEYIGAIPPLIIGAEYICAAANYGGEFSFSFQFHKSKALENKYDLEDFLTAFRNSLKDLEKQAKSTLVI